MSAALGLAQTQCPRGLSAREDKYRQRSELVSPWPLCSFNRAVPKFMKRIKVPDYKDRNVFGVPLTVNVQRTGQPLPQSIQQAMRYLRNHCLDQVGRGPVESWTTGRGPHHAGDALAIPST